MEPIRLAIVGDTQRVLPIERLAFGRETKGRFDQDYPLDELASKRILVCRGNHDCGGLWFGSPREFNRRFPEAIARLQEVELGSLRLLLLDTNEQAMSREQWRVQLDRFQSALARADAEIHVKHVLVAGHHPPFTNARWHAPSRAVLENFVPPFLRCAKARAFLAGHVHGYERFSVEGKWFVVTGGGGGARFSHRHGDRCRKTAVLDWPDPHPLHFIAMEAGPESVAFSVRAFDEVGGTLKDLDRWSA